MTPEEKWQRICSPKSPEDYGLWMTEDELETFEEGRQTLSYIRQDQEERHKFEHFGRRVGRAAAAVIDREIRETLARKSHE